MTEIIKANWNGSFMAAVVYDDVPIPRRYTISLRMLIKNDKSIEMEDQNLVSIQRLDYFISNIINDSMVINADNDLLTYYLEQDKLIQHVMLPDRVSDIILAKSLFIKLNCITPDTLVVSHLILGGDGVLELNINHESDFDELSYKPEAIHNDEIVEMNNWWKRGDTSTFNALMLDQDTNEQFEYSGVHSWDEIGLGFIDEEENIIDEEKSSDNVIYTNVFKAPEADNEA